MANSADPDQLASSDLHCLQRQDISGFRRTRVKNLCCSPVSSVSMRNLNFSVSDIVLQKKVFNLSKSLLFISLYIEQSIMN